MIHVRSVLLGGVIALFVGMVLGACAQPGSAQSQATDGQPIIKRQFYLVYEERPHPGTICYIYSGQGEKSGISCLLDGRS